MRTVATTWVVLAAILAASRALSLPAETAAPVDAKAEAATLVHAALAAEVAGNRESRGQLLRDAIKKDPDSVLAHWSAGEMRQGPRWLSVEETQRQAASDKRRTEYRRLRGQWGDTPAGQAALP